MLYSNREWIEYYLESEIADSLDNVAGTSVYFGAKNLMAYAQLCLVASQIGRQAVTKLNRSDQIIPDNIRPPSLVI